MIYYKLPRESLDYRAVHDHFQQEIISHSNATLLDATDRLPDDATGVVVFGLLGTQFTMLREAIDRNITFWHIDKPYFNALSYVNCKFLRFTKNRLIIDAFDQTIDADPTSYKLNYQSQNQLVDIDDSRSGITLIIPPSLVVCKLYDINQSKWIDRAISQVKTNKHIVRLKKCQYLLDDDGMIVQHVACRRSHDVAIDHDIRIAEDIICTDHSVVRYQFHQIHDHLDYQTRVDMMSRLANNQYSLDQVRRMLKELK